MSTTSTSSPVGGIGVPGVLTIIFVVLKLTHVIDWDWWWVLAPLWISFLLFVIVAAIFITIAVVVSNR